MRSKKQYSTEMRERKSKEIRILKVMMTVFNLLFYPFASTLSHFSFPLLSCSIYFMFMFHSCDFKIFIGSSTYYDFFLIAVLVHDQVDPGINLPDNDHRSNKWRKYSFVELEIQSTFAC